MLAMQTLGLVVNENYVAMLNPVPQVVAPPEEQGFGEQVAVAIRDWIVERLQDYHANLGTDTRLMEARPGCTRSWSLVSQSRSI